MKISLNTLRDINQRYGTTSQDSLAIGVDQLAEKIGAQLGGIEEIISLGKKYEGVVIAKVAACEQHPNADRLHVCKIDDGGKVEGLDRDSEGFVQVVCGAPNVREGLTVAWLPPGATVPETADKDPFVLGARELRGVVSNGMLASPKELAISDSHDGILEIDGEHTPGTDFAEAFGLKDDVVFDIENKMFTHRPDCFGWLGVAREIAGIQGIAFKSPDWFVSQPGVLQPEADVLPLNIVNEVPELAPRFTAITMRDIQIAPSPVWLQVTLMKVGLRPINNIVDLTNLLMLKTGQPLHAYDYDKVKARSNSEATMVVRRPKPGEKLLLLNGKEIEPRADAVMIATDKELIGLGGVMGGGDTEVDDDTKNIIIECANFDMYSIRRTSMAHGLFTDAVTRFNKGQSPLQTVAVLSKIVDEVRNLAGGKVASQVIDDNHLAAEVLESGSLHKPVVVTTEFINARLGLGLSAEEMKALLENVEFKVDAQGDELTVKAPFWRTDVELREDVVEEVGRLYGYDHLPLELPARVITPTAKDALMTFKGQVCQSLVKAGANEVLTYSFVPGKLLQNAGQNPDEAFKVSNALSPDLQYYRLSLTPSLLEKIHPNIKAGYDQFALFELGKAHLLGHNDEEGLPVEYEMLDLVVAASDKVKQAGAAYYQARLYLDTLAGDCGVNLSYEPFEQPSDYAVAKPYDLARAALVKDRHSGEILGVVGEFSAATRKAFKLPKFCAGFSINPKHLMAACQQAADTYQPLPRFPKVSQDITLSVASELHFQELNDFATEQVQAQQPEHSTTHLELLDIYQKPDSPQKNITLRLNIANYERTLTDKEVNKLLDEVAAAANQRFGAERV